MQYVKDIIARATGITEDERRTALSELDLPPSQNEILRVGQIGIMRALLERYCADNELPYESVDTLAYRYPTHAQWLGAYIRLFGP
jgi:hypothetical protein